MNYVNANVNNITVAARTFFLTFPAFCSRHISFTGWISHFDSFSHFYVMKINVRILVAIRQHNASNSRQLSAQIKIPNRLNTKKGKTTRWTPNSHPPSWLGLLLNNLCTFCKHFCKFKRYSTGSCPSSRSTIYRVGGRNSNPIHHPVLRCC